jgi:sigma-B regulation protein RsbU (phosphoserine phosphatase)
MHGTATPISIDLLPPPRPLSAPQAPTLTDASGHFVAPPAQLSPEVLEHQLARMREQMESLRGELNDLRRRDETLNFYLHRVDEELRLAARLQQDFLPKELPQVGPVQFHSLFRPAGYVSGDLYDVMRLDENHVGFYMADAVGHGVPAALLAMFLKHALQTKDRNGALLEPSETLRRLNTLLLEQGLSQSTFATAIYGTINTRSLELRLARAGHPCPILMRGDGGVEELDSHGCLLGVFEDETFDGYVTTLLPGDRMLIYSDGIEVAFWDDQHTQEAQELHRWRRELIARRHMDAERLLTEFDEHLDQEKGSLSARDDLTMLLIDVVR